MKEFTAVLGDKHKPDSEDYCIGTRQSALAKQLEGWARVGEFTNHGEVMVILSKPKATAKAPGIFDRAKTALGIS